MMLLIHDVIMEHRRDRTESMIDMMYTYLINWGWEISMTHCMLSTGDGNMDFQKNLPLKENTKATKEPFFINFVCHFFSSSCFFVHLV